jgi:hypothetical protein
VADVTKHACGGAMSGQLQAADLSVDAVETKYVRLQSG